MRLRHTAHPHSHSLNLQSADFQGEVRGAQVRPHHTHPGRSPAEVSGRGQPHHTPHHHTHPGRWPLTGRSFRVRCHRTTPTLAAHRQKFQRLGGLGDAGTLGHGGTPRHYGTSRHAGTYAFLVRTNVPSCQRTSVPAYGCSPQGVIVLASHRPR